MSTSQAQEPKAVVDKSTYRDLAAKNPNFTESAPLISSLLLSMAKLKNHIFSRRPERCQSLQIS